MEHISSRVATVAEQTVSPNILVVCRTFLPKEGGIEEYIYNRCLQDTERVIVLTASCAGDKAFDKSQLFPVYRWQTPKSWGHSWSQNILQPFLNTVWSAILAIKLYFRYHYRYIEWGHGYGFISLLFLSYLLPIRFLSTCTGMIFYVLYVIRLCDRCLHLLCKEQKVLFVTAAGPEIY